MPVIVHTGSPSFPGARARFGDPALMLDPVDDFPVDGGAVQVVGLR